MIDTSFEMGAGGGGIGKSSGIAVQYILGYYILDLKIRK
jgi:hypothetical protein